TKNLAQAGRRAGTSTSLCDHHAAQRAEPFASGGTGPWLTGQSHDPRRRDPEGFGAARASVGTRTGGRARRGALGPRSGRQRPGAPATPAVKVTQSIAAITGTARLGRSRSTRGSRAPGSCSAPPALTHPW